MHFIRCTYWILRMSVAGIDSKDLRKSMLAFVASAVPADLNSFVDDTIRQNRQLIRAMHPLHRNSTFYRQYALQSLITSSKCLLGSTVCDFPARKGDNFGIR